MTFRTGGSEFNPIYRIEFCWLSEPSICMIIRMSPAFFCAAGNYICAADTHIWVYAFDHLGESELNSIYRTQFGWLSGQEDPNSIRGGGGGLRLRQRGPAPAVAALTAHQCAPGQEALFGFRLSRCQSRRHSWRRDAEDGFVSSAHGRPPHRRCCADCPIAAATADRIEFCWLSKPSICMVFRKSPAFFCAAGNYLTTWAEPTMPTDLQAFWKQHHRWRRIRR